MTRAARFAAQDSAFQREVDIFDGWKVYLVGCEMYDLVLYRKTGEDNKIEVFNAPEGIFDTVITQTYDYLENLVDSHAQ